MYQSENTFEFNPEMSGFETEQYEGEQYEGEQFEQYEYGEAEWGEVFNESEVMELAAELLEVTNEAELDRFLGNLIKKAGSALGKVVKSPIGQAVGGVLKGVAKKALPIAGGALGAYFGGPLGAKIGSGLASAAGSALGLELETLNQEDREFEGGKQFVRFAANTVKNAVSAPPAANPRSTAQMAANKAAQVYVPNLITSGPALTQPSAMPSKGRGGRWFRRGRNIVIVNC
ncbi:MAG TPA: hypothetical protein PKD88_00190 [Nitrosomonas sp.]|nr:hypothetical protein [Nitrosomonas sp.]HMW19405.1 hypothetical protein [Nitrosomonas sp.]HMW68583.1 hypothetical protein [Nitrosomonas sp.]HMY61203.1 hypothetical protein [Nitrosomonas sp.]HMY89888.1 hypothetical protein [Nitrosomonas sp.]